MIYKLVGYLMEKVPELSFLRLFRKITYRSAAALALAFLLTLLLGPLIIRTLKKWRIGQQIRKIHKEGAPDLYDMHGNKEGTPTMGGLMILSSVLLAVLLLCDLSSRTVLLLIVTTVAFGAVGFLDDYLKITQRNTKGLIPRVKRACQLLIGFFLGLYLFNTDLGVYYLLHQGGPNYLRIEGGTHLTVPFVKTFYPDLGVFYIFFVMLVITATSNAVNLTDGLDGLAIGITIIVALSFGLIAYLVGRADFAKYLLFPYVPDGGEITIYLSALVGAGMGFLWYNSHPAEIFMGDTGSITIGGVIGTIAILLKQEFMLFMVGGIFVVEVLSVIIQVVSYKTRGKRVFLMAPLHHHFEKMGLAESKIISRFWIVAALLALFGLSTLKLR